MVNFVNSWMKEIIVAIIITIIIEMILPEGKNKKYIKTVMNIYIVFTIISPLFAKITNKSIDTSKILADYEIPEIAVNTIDNNKYIEETYIEKIKQDIILRLENMGYKTEEIKIEINTNDEQYGEIEKIYLILNKAKDEKIMKINKININDETNQTEEILEEEDRKKISEYLITNYGVDETNIIIGGSND